MNFKEQAREYLKSGLCVLPASKHKLPILAWEKYNDVMSDESIFDVDSFGMALVCGKISGNVEVIDIDNKFRDSHLFFEKIIEHMGDTSSQFVINRTTSGGYHLVYRCDVIEGNQKLCMRENQFDWDFKRQKHPIITILETRGQRGIIIVPPTQGYRTIQGDMLSINRISVEERNKLIDYCKSLTEAVETKKEFTKAPSTGDRIGDQFNAWHSSAQYVKALLIDKGWVFTTATMVNRPGHKDGHSATFGVIGTGCLYVWSSNAYPFEPTTTYTPFSILAMLECGGSWRDAVIRAKEIME
jgi:hypothetical protein